MTVAVTAALTVTACGAAPASSTAATSTQPVASTTPAQPTASADGPGAVQTLAKVDGWREHRGWDSPFAVLELAYDADTARALWEASVPAGLPDRDGNPVQEGIYGDLSGVDYSSHAVALWSSGESGVCPSWLATVGSDPAGRVTLAYEEDLMGGSGCTDDYHSYRTFVVVDRDDVPDPSHVAEAEGVVVSGPSVRIEAVVEAFDPS